MELRSYLETAQRGTGSWLARTLGVSSVMVSQWASGLKQVPAERCPEIERATEGKVRCEDLRPDVAWEVLREQGAPLVVMEGAPPPFPSVARSSADTGNAGAGEAAVEAHDAA